MYTVNVNKLRGKMVENGVKMEDLAQKVGINRATLYRKFNEGGENFSIGEAFAISDVIGLSKAEAIEIFFSSNVA